MSDAVSEYEMVRFRQDLEFFPLRHGKETVVVVRDHLGLVEEGRALPFQLYELLILLDGTRSVRDLQMILMRRQHGVLVSAAEVEELLAYLDECFLLHTDRYVRAKVQREADFLAQPARQSAHQDQAYPADPLELRKQLDDILAQCPGPTSAGPVAALVAPHIDLSVGARVYAHAYRCLEETSPDRVVVLGVGHQMRGDLFSLTEKRFMTPLGETPSDTTAVRELKTAGGKIIADNDFAHKAEHSVEFQVLFLQHLLPPDSFTLVPILCGPLSPTLTRYTREDYRARAGNFLDALREMVSDPSCRTLLVAGVDLAHTGPKFGHEDSGLSMAAQSQQHDERLLRALREKDADEFWSESAREGDRFNVCGFSAMACLLEVLPPSKGRILDYHLWHEEPTRSAVSFAAAAFTGE